MLTWSRASKKNLPMGKFFLLSGVGAFKVTRTGNEGTARPGVYCTRALSPACITASILSLWALT
jgi:hypothetical protein